MLFDTILTRWGYAGSIQVLRTGELTTVVIVMYQVHPRKNYLVLLCHVSMQCNYDHHFHIKAVSEI
jgi:hypothetical protein